jgi:hypothetical protein
MMKKYYKYTFVLLLLFPLMINATTYNVAKSSANEYYRNIDNDGRYFRLDSLHYGYTNSGITNISDFKTGGLLNETEYIISKSGISRSSYLAPGNNYWIMPKSGKTYILGTGIKEIDRTSNAPNTRVTEYLRHSIRSSGKGTIDNPWVFEEVYKISVTVKNKTGGSIVKEVKYVSKKGNATFEYIPATGYTYGAINCEGIDNNSTTVSKDEGRNSITIRNITSNIDCKVLFTK